MPSPELCQAAEHALARGTGPLAGRPGAPEGGGAISAQGPRPQSLLLANQTTEQVRLGPRGLLAVREARTPPRRQARRPPPTLRVELSHVRPSPFSPLAFLPFSLSPADSDPNPLSGPRATPLLLKAEGGRRFARMKEPEQPLSLAKSWKNLKATEEGPEEPKSRGGKRAPGVE